MKNKNVLPLNLYQYNQIKELCCNCMTWSRIFDNIEILKCLYLLVPNHDSWNSWLRSSRDRARLPSCWSSLSSGYVTRSKCRVELTATRACAPDGIWACRLTEPRSCANCPRCLPIPFWPRDPKSICIVRDLLCPFYYIIEYQNKLSFFKCLKFEY